MHTRRRNKIFPLEGIGGKEEIEERVDEDDLYSSAGVKFHLVSVTVAVDH